MEITDHYETECLSVDVGHAVVSEVLDCSCRRDQAVVSTSHVNIKDIQSEIRHGLLLIDLFVRNVLQ